eukprot:CAMPEP_0181114098 /NCGR_PEP_ID=MMETSP1071-20121207/20698_1 /TAXON_ID=35127 /ORGANISM="Thalassiosira sp., Strain NH16" /LENGTH=409 /DNA_ID=CAMNT_0023198177 /DNA_START=224 /DNA_END=1453 /DNA_ORIENTATION=+
MVKHDIVNTSSSTTTSAFLANGRKINASASIPTTKGKLDLNTRSPSKVATVANETVEELWIEGDYDSLPEVDMFYPIERTSAVIVDCFDPREISRRITGCLQKLSIVAKLDTSDYASLLAEALDYTTFHIRLYKHDTINENKGILVELQRVGGDSFNYMKYVKAILAAARGEAIDESKKSSRRRSSLTYIPASILPSNVKEEYRQPAEPNAKCIMHIEELVNEDRSDAVLLGIESLLLLTDQERSHVSLSAAEAVLNGTGHSVIKDFVHKCIRCPRSTLSQEDNEFEYASRQCAIMHNIALAVLGNSLQTASGAECPVLSSVLQSEEWLGQSGIVDVLLSELSNADPHDAYHAARCLNTLLDSAMPELKAMLIERGLPRAMRVSQKVGHRRHSLLAQECDSALMSMENV